MGKPAHALVIGGSMAGLLAARVLSDQFARVTIVERDEFRDEPESRKGQPQTRHVHGLLASGTQILSRLFPGLVDELAAGGALVGDQAETMRWYCLGGYRSSAPYGMLAATPSRTFLEWRVRRRVQALPNVTLRGGCGIAGLVAAPDCSRVTGVRLTAPDGDGELIEADLVVDATGRGSAAPRWLAALGYAAPAESKVRVDVGYATRVYRRLPGDPLGDKWIVISPRGSLRAMTSATSWDSRLRA